MAWYYSPNQTSPVWVDENINIHTTATSTVGTVWYDAGWDLGTGGVTSATTVISPTFWIRRGLAFTVQQAETLERLVDATQLPPQQPISSPAILRRPRQTHETQEDYDTRRSHESAAMSERQREFNEIQTRARELLLEHLTPEQRDTFVNRGWFVVEGKRQRYRIETHRGYSGNVVRLADASNGRYEQRYCAHCDPGVAPGHDQFLAQKFMLEHAEDDFLRIANRGAQQCPGGSNTPVR